jgi:hypothetical protein
MPRPNRYDALAARIAILNLFVGLIFAFFTKSIPFKTISQVILIFSIVAYFLLLAHYFYLAKGYQWARILYLILYTISLLFLAVGYQKVISNNFGSALKTVSFLVQWALSSIPTYFVLKSLKEYSKLKAPSTSSNGFRR